MREVFFALALAGVSVGCSWPEYAFPNQPRGCTDDMLVCLRMDRSPADEGWTFTQSGEAHADIIDGFDGNRVLRFRANGSEVPPGPVAKFSWNDRKALATARLLFDFRVAMVGPYTQAVVAEVVLGERALRFMLRHVPPEQDPPKPPLVLQLVNVDPIGALVLEEAAVPEPSLFEQTRLVQLTYWLEGPGRMATVSVEGAAVAQLALGDDWVTAPPALQFGAVDYTFPTSDAEFELDNLGFAGGQ